MKPLKMCVLMLLSPASFAAPVSNYINFNASAAANWSDNGGRQSGSAETISEQQNEYGLGVDGIYQNEWFAATSRYALDKKTFSENSQPDDTMFTGNGQLDFGGSSQPLHLKIEHSRTSLLNAQDALDITSNRLDRSIFTVEPSVRWRLTDSDQIAANISKSDITYTNFETKNSTQKNVELIYSRDVSPLDIFKLVASSGKTDFDFYPLMSYRLDSLVADYSVSLRNLQYGVSVGGNRAVREISDNDFSSPKYSAKLSYVNAFNTFTIDFSQGLGDSSRSDSSSFSSITDAGPIDNILTPGASKGIDIVNFRTAGISWASTAACERCSSRLALESVKQDFKNLDEDLDSVAASLMLSYRLSRDSNVEFLYRYSRQSFAQDLLSPHQNDTNYQLTYRTQILDSLSLSALIKRYKRDSETGYQSYNESIVGVGLDYSF